MTTTLTASERQVLYELDGAPDKTLSLGTLYAAAPHSLRLTQTGLQRVLRRLEARRMVDLDGGAMSLTFGGMQALAGEQVSA